MGCCNSAPAKTAETKKVDRDLKADRQIDEKIKKLLFLGSGGSGKSTLFKQLRTLHGDGYKGNDRIQFKEHIFAQIIEQMRLAIDCIEILKEDFPNKYGNIKLSNDAENAADMINNLSPLTVNDEVAQAIKCLWDEDAIRIAYENRAIMKLEDSTAHFWNSVDRVSKKDFIPTDEDILLVRYRTTGVIEQKFEIQSNQFHIFDVGGQKSERKKWIHCFEHVTAVIFVAALSCYDEVMFEDEETNSMMDSLDLFDKICNNEYFTETSMILFLNKDDLFAKKIKTIPLTVCEDFKETFEGDENSYDECREFIKTQFESKNRQDGKQIFSHFTCATDKSNVEKVFGDVQHAIINESLQQGGLM